MDGSNSVIAAETTNQSRKTRVFLSYSRQDLVFAQILLAALEDDGFDVLMDKTDIAPGEDWKGRLGALILQADTVVFVVSPASCASEICGWEVAHAQGRGKRILPVVAKSVDMATVPAALARLNFLFFEGRPVNNAVAELRQSLSTDIDWLRQHTVLAERAEEWRKGESRALVLRGKSLDEAEHWLALTPATAAATTTVHREFVQASRKAASNRQRNWLTGAITVALVSVALAAWGEINRREAVAKQAEAETERNRATQVLNAASQAANGMVINLARRYRNQRGVPTTVVENILAETQRLQTELFKVAEKDKALRESAALAALELAETYRSQNAFVAGGTAVDEAAAIYESLGIEEPENLKWQKGLAIAYLEKGETRNSYGSYKGARIWIESALEIAAQHARHESSDMEWQFILARSQRAMGLVEVKLGNLNAAEMHVDLALAQFAVLLPEDRIRKGSAEDVQFDPLGVDTSIREKRQLPDRIVWLHEKARTLEAVGQYQLARNQVYEAIQSFLVSLQIFNEIYMTDILGNVGWEMDLWRVSMRAGDAAMLKPDYAGAESVFKYAHALASKVQSPDSDNTVLQRLLTVSATRLGDIRQAYKDTEGAIRYYEEAFRNATKVKKLQNLEPMLTYELAVTKFKLSSLDPDYEYMLQEAKSALDTVRDKQKRSRLQQSDLQKLEIPIEPILP